MKFRGFTLIGLLVVVAIIGILAAVGVNTFTGFQEKAKISVTKNNYNAMYKKILMQIQLCEIDGSVELMRLPKNTTKYKVDCSTTSNHQLYMFYIINHMNNSGNPKNPYGDQSQGGIGTDDAYVRTHYTNATQDHIIGFVTLYTKGSNMVILHACFQTPCSKSSNRLYNEIALP